MKKVKDWLLKDIWLKVVSLLLAVVIWFVWIQIENPTITKDFSNVKVSLINQESLDPDKKVWEILNNTDTVRVTVVAPKTVINEITSSDIIAEADASKMVNNEIPITLRLAGDLTYDSMTPNHDSMSISMEDRAHRYLTLAADVTGEVAENHKRGSVTMSPNMIEISGPASDIDKVAHGIVTIDVTGASESLSANVKVELYDENLDLLSLPNVKLQQNYISVVVDVLETKAVSIYASRTGEAGEGYLYARNIKVYPEQVAVAGTAEDLQNINRINITDPIDISGAESDVEASVDITPYIPKNLVFANDDFDGMVNVKIFVEPEKTRNITFAKEGVSFINIPEGWNLSMEGDYITGELSGLEGDIESIDVDNIGKIINVSEWMDDNDMTDLTEGYEYMPVTLGISSSVKVSTVPVVRVRVQKAISEATE